MEKSRNPIAARLLFWVGRKGYRIPFRALSLVLGVEMPCRDYGDLFLPHPVGIILHPTTKTGKGVTIFQHVTVASHHRINKAATIDDFATIGTGAVLIGPVCIGKHAVVGANAVVTEDVPDNVTVAGIPARPLVARRYLG